MPEAHLVIVGSGEYEEKIQELILELDLKSDVTRIPWIDHDKLPSLLSASDIFMYPSLSYGGWEEQFGYSMAEASLMELPVISTWSGSISDVVLDKKTGLLVKGDNLDELRDAMETLARDEAFRKELGNAGRQYIASNFSHKNIAHRFADFFSEVL
jgi:phosphatidylinositol alpha-1,6-mannosyltransferase